MVSSVCSSLSTPSERPLPASGDLSQEHGVLLLRLARATLHQFLTGGAPSREGPPDATLAQLAGVFVTLWQRSPGGSLALRGCIGRVQADQPIYRGVQEAVISAATRDPRFPPVTLPEVDGLLIEIAILSPLTKVTTLEEICPGRDGLLIVGMGRRGLLLPDVATRQGWDTPSFLAGVCRKAGLPCNCWPGCAELYAFTTIAFGEEPAE